jgi:hypothetical protein
VQARYSGSTHRQFPVAEQREFTIAPLVDETISNGGVEAADEGIEVH